jgi:transmembrane sensor
MSEGSEANAKIADDRNRIDDEAVAWVERSDREDWTSNDQVELDAWLSQSDAYLVAFLRVESRWRRADRLVALRGSFDTGAPVSTRRSIGMLPKLGAAAAVILVLGGGWFAWPSNKAPAMQYATAIGEHKFVKFVDGTQAELNTDSQIRIQFDAHNRTVWVEKGETFFQVTHNASRPFVVFVAGERVTDLGTKFTVEKLSNQVRVALVEGRAKIDVPARPEISEKVLLPGDVAIATSNSLSITKQAPANIQDDLAWRRGLLILNHTMLADAVAQMNRYNERKIIIADADAGRQRIDGTFPTNNVDLFGRVARNILGLHVSQSGNDIVISR